MANGEIAAFDSARGMPDPSAAAKEALNREIAALKEIVLQQVMSVQSVADERSERVSQQFDLVERQRVEQKIDTKSAVDAALIAQKEAVREQTNASERAIAKSESAIKEQLAQLTLTFSAEVSALRSRQDEIKESVQEVDKRSNGLLSQQLGAKGSQAALFGGIGAVVGVLGIVGALVALLLR